MHTKEPWIVVVQDESEGGYARQWPVVTSANGGIEIIGTEGFYSDIEVDKANARRVVACVNACAGSSTEGLEEMVAAGRSVANMAMLYERAMDRRDDLLAALKGLVEYYRLQSQPKEAREILKIMRNTIAKAEGLQE